MKKNVLIVGGLNGIGKLISDFYKDSSKYNTVITSRKFQNKNKKINNNFKFFNLNLTKLNNLNKFYNFLKLNKIKNFDIVIICAGTLGKITEFEKSSLSSLKKTFEVNFFGQVKLCLFFLKKKLFKKSSNLIFFSTSLFIPDPKFVEYTTSKHAQYALMLTLSKELRSKNIYVNCIMPGQMHTKMNQKKINSKKLIDKKIYKQAKKIKKLGNKKKLKKIHNTLEFITKKNSRVNLNGKIISAQHDNLKNIRFTNKKLFTFIRNM